MDDKSKANMLRMAYGIVGLIAERGTADDIVRVEDLMAKYHRGLLTAYDLVMVLADVGGNSG